MATCAKTADLPQDPSAIAHPTLIAFPSEIMLNIVKWLPQTSLTALVQTCTYFRLFISGFGMAICNDQLLALYPDFFRLFEVTKHLSGWFVPASQGFARASEIAQQKVDFLFQYPADFRSTYYSKFNAHVNIVKAASYTMSLQQISLMFPGPQLLAFLDRHSQVLRSKYKHMVTIGGKDEKEWFSWMATYAIEPFLTSRLRVQATMWFYASASIKSHDLGLHEVEAEPRKRRGPMQGGILKRILNSV